MGEYPKSDPAPGRAKGETFRAHPCTTHPQLNFVYMHQKVVFKLHIIKTIIFQLSIYKYKISSFDTPNATIESFVHACA